VYGSVGQPEAGLRELSEALALVEKTGERWWEAELWRMKGELLLQQGKVAREKKNDKKRKAKISTPQ
jgi:predicted negative regulator of RcsB-dependent stress response